MRLTVVRLACQFLLPLIFSGLFYHLNAQSDGSLNSKTADSIRHAGAMRIDSSMLKPLVYSLASDAMAGRETGTPGNDSAAQFIAEKFRQAGLLPVGPDSSYFQPFDLVTDRWEKISLKVNGENYRHLWDFYSLMKLNGSPGKIDQSEVIFAGYGIQEGRIDHYRKTDVEGKVVLMYAGEPRNKKGESIITGDTSVSEWTSNPFKKIELAKNLGAELVLVISENFKSDLAENRKFLIGPPFRLSPPINDSSTGLASSPGYMFINTNIARQIMGEQIKTKKLQKWRKKRRRSPKPVGLEAVIDAQMTRNRNVKHTRNVVALLPGYDSTSADEHVVITAHYDHLGKRGKDIFNGADDNASGTATVLELAQQFAENANSGYPNKRPVLFLLVSGEEKGLLGSEYFVEYPVTDLDNIMTNVNIDMVGRTDGKHEQRDYIYVIGADRLSTDLHNVNEEVNRKFENLELDYTYNEKNDPNRFYYRSDHYNFAKNGIPAVFFFSGTHEDYHRPSDTAEKIDFVKMIKINRHIYHLICELANRSEEILVDVNREKYD